MRRTKTTHPNNAPPAETSTVSVSERQDQRERTNYHHAPPPTVCVRSSTVFPRSSPPSVRPRSGKAPLPRRPIPKRTGVTGPQHGRHPSTGVPRPTNHTRPSPGRTRARGGGLGPLTQPCGERGDGGGMYLYF